MPELTLLGGPPRRGRRRERNPVDPARPYAILVEPERTRDGLIEDVATVFLTNKECPFRCVFCDLWKNTTVDRVPVGAVAAQVEWALAQLPAAPHVKLYNSGNFFDDQAVPRADRPRIARLLAGRRTVIVECHPRLVDRRCLSFAGAIDGRLEVAMGLETVDPKTLPRLNKDMTLADFVAATQFLVRGGIGVRAFILLPAPFQSLAAGIEWACRSIEFAFSIGVECCSLIPLRSDHASWERPTLRAMETVLDFGVSLGKGRVFMDVWDLQRWTTCETCGPARAARLRELNLTQRSLPSISCDCGT